MIENYIKFARQNTELLDSSLRYQERLDYSSVPMPSYETLSRYELYEPLAEAEVHDFRAKHTELLGLAADLPVLKYHDAVTQAELIVGLLSLYKGQEKAVYKAELINSLFWARSLADASPVAKETLFADDFTSIWPTDKLTACIEPIKDLGEVRSLARAIQSLESLFYKAGDKRIVDAEFAEEIKRERAGLVQTICGRRSDILHIMKNMPRDTPSALDTAIFKLGIPKPSKEERKRRRAEGRFSMEMDPATFA